MKHALLIGARLVTIQRGTGYQHEGIVLDQTKHALHLETPRGRKIILRTNHTTIMHQVPREKKQVHSLSQRRR